MKVYDRIKDMLCDELEDISKQKELTPGNLDMIDTAIDVIKDITTIKAMEKEYPDEGYSQDGGYSRGYYQRMPFYIYDDPGMGSRGNSYARGRDTQGRFYDEGYSRDTKETLEKLMHETKNDQEREAIRSALEHMRR